VLLFAIFMIWLMLLLTGANSTIPMFWFMSLGLSEASVVQLEAVKMTWRMFVLKTEILMKFPTAFPFHWWDFHRILMGAEHPSIIRVENAWWRKGMPVSPLRLTKGYINLGLFEANSHTKICWLFTT
jgi:hypothetical protein